MVPVRRAKRVHASVHCRDNEPAVVPDRTLCRLAGEGQFPRQRARLAVQSGQAVGFREDQQPVAGARLELRLRRNDPLLCPGRPVVCDDPVGGDGEEGVRRVVRRRHRQWIVERERPDGLNREERVRHFRLRFGRKNASPTDGDDHERPTTYGGQHRYNTVNLQASRLGACLSKPEHAPSRPASPAKMGVIQNETARVARLLGVRRGYSDGLLGQVPFRVSPGHHRSRFRVAVHTTHRPPPA